MRFARITLLSVLCLFLMGQDYNIQFTRRSGGGGVSELSALIFGGSRANIPTADTVFYPIWAGVQTDDGVITESEQVISAPGNFTDMRIELSGDIGTATDDSTWTLMKNGSDTSLTCDIDGAGDTEDDCEVSSTVAVVAGDRVVLKVVTLNTPAGVKPGWSFHFTSTNDDEQNLLGHYDSTHTSATRHGPVGGGHNNGDFGAVPNQTLFPISGTIKNLRIAVDVCPGSGATRVYTVMVNENPTSISCQLTGTSCGLACSDTSTSPVTVNAGDRVVIRDTPSNTPVTMETAVGLTFVTGTTNKFIFGPNYSGNAPSTTVNTYIHVSGLSQVITDLSVRESAVQRAFTVTNMNIRLNTAPGGTDSWAFTLLDDGVDTSPIVECVVTGTAKVCGTDFSGTTSIANDAEITIEIDPSAGGPIVPLYITIGLAGTVP